jgi:3-deoxy-D-manno-octulosonate 8-phosphate phosphatase KdsC-like HAD superfamily phosphatase
MYITIVNAEEDLENEVNDAINHLKSMGDDIVDIRYMKENTFYIIHR